MARKYFGRNRRSEILVSDYIDESRTLNRVIGSTVLLYLMADEHLDSSTYRRLVTSARAIRDRNESHHRMSAEDYSGQQYLFRDEDIAYLTGDSHEHKR